MVFSGFVMLCRLAGCPTRTSPLSKNATTDGVVRAPSAFSITFEVLTSITATQELVVPRSMPIAFAMGNASVAYALSWWVFILVGLHPGGSSSWWVFILVGLHPGGSSSEPST